MSSWILLYNIHYTVYPFRCTIIKQSFNHKLYFMHPCTTLSALVTAHCYKTWASFLTKFALFIDACHISRCFAALSEIPMLWLSINFLLCISSVSVFSFTMCGRWNKFLEVKISKWMQYNWTLSCGVHSKKWNLTCLLLNLEILVYNSERSLSNFFSFVDRQLVACF